MVSLVMEGHVLDARRGFLSLGKKMMGRQGSERWLDPDTWRWLAAEGTLEQEVATRTWRRRRQRPNRWKPDVVTGG